MGELVRRVLAVGLAITAAILLLGTRPDAAASSQQLAVVAARDLPAGHLLRPADLVVAALPGAATPPGTYTAPDELAGLIVVGGLAAGEPLTPRRVLDPAGPYAVPPGTTPVVVAVSDPATLLPLRPGSCVDLYAGPAGLPVQPVATDAYFVTALEPPDDATGAIAPQDQFPRSHAVIAITSRDVQDVLEALTTDYFFATVCPV